MVIFLLRNWVFLSHPNFSRFWRFQKCNLLRAQNYLHPNQINLFFKGKYHPSLFQVFFSPFVGIVTTKLKQFLPKKVGLKIDFSISRSLQYGPQLMEWDPKNPLKTFLCMCIYCNPISLENCWHSQLLLKNAKVEKIVLHPKVATRP